LCHNENVMPKVTKKLGNNKARAWESLGFAHKKKLCQHFDTTSWRIFSSYFERITATNCNVLE
ncbi:hypothetical protein NCZ32_24895, partial [Bacteroides faecis]|nr:hypothetical protein [Bacteroides faecis]MCM1771723.1 hypothetical protein [Bacteroides faecis]MCM1776886.1 hypothetical protein [Bacteroides faecis]MCM1921875.1 hypothetical protein [Bacteroides faecis]